MNEQHHTASKEEYRKASIQIQLYHNKNFSDACNYIFEKKLFQSKKLVSLSKKLQRNLFRKDSL